jgi:hypothetical protein
LVDVGARDKAMILKHHLEHVTIQLVLETVLHKEEVDDFQEAKVVWEVVLPILSVDSGTMTSFEALASQSSSWLVFVLYGT